MGYRLCRCQGMPSGASRMVRWRGGRPHGSEGPLPSRDSMVLRGRHLPEPKLRTRDYMDRNCQLQVSHLPLALDIVLIIQTLRTCGSIQKIPRQIRFHHRYLQRSTPLGQRARPQTQGSRSLVPRIQQLPRRHGSSRPRRNHAKRVRQETH
jgi:hypothetical protein